MLNKSEFCEWLKDNISEANLYGTKIIAFPVYPHGDDPITVFIERNDNSDIILSDRGDTFGILTKEFGFMAKDMDDFQKTYLKFVLNVNGVNMDGDEIFMKTNGKKLYQDLLQFIFTLYSIHYLYAIEKE